MTKPEDARKAAEALLALGMTREQAKFLPPSEEEMAQLLDSEAAQALDPTRKAQIMDAIANDPETFSRWMNAVDMAKTLQVGNFAENVSFETSSERPTTLVSRIGQFLAEHVRAVMATGGAGVAVAFAVVLMLPVGMDSQVSRLYDDFGGQWAAQPQKLDVIRSGKTQQQAALSIPDQRLKEGVEAGLAMLGEDFRITQLNQSSVTDTSSLETELSESLFALGQIAAISHFKCFLGAEKDYYSASWALIQDLAPAIKAGSDETSKALAKTLDRKGSAETQVCRIGKQVVARVSR
ncbi:MAG: hypothetical protein C9356_10495 [Oleiphilus sp.]|nr:MAG: hypothetical protein C9356_10495 [Oleiphilus sp.]